MPFLVWHLLTTVNFRCLGPRERSKRGPRYTAYQTILATFSHYNPTNDVKLRYLRSHSNIRSFISYFLFTVTDQVEKIIAKLKRVPWDSDFHNVLSRSEYQVLKSNLVYVGSGQTKRPFEHVTYTNYLLNGITMENTQKIHYFLAKGVRQNLFQKVLIIPFFSSNNYAGCLYSEQATIWVLGNHTLNNHNLEFDKIKHNMSVDRSNPEKYLKNAFSKTFSNRFNLYTFCALFCQTPSSKFFVCSL